MVSSAMSSPSAPSAPKGLSGMRTRRNRRATVPESVPETLAFPEAEPGLVAWPGGKCRWAVARRDSSPDFIEAIARGLDVVRGFGAGPPGMWLAGGGGG